MNFTFQVDNPAGAGMSNRRKQLIQALITMQLSAFLLLALGLQVSAATYSQTVSFTGKDVPLKTVLSSVCKQSGYVYFADERFFETAKPISVDLQNVPIEQFLKICFKDQPFSYGIAKKTIFLMEKEPVITVAPSSTPSDPIIQIKGRVTNDKGEPLVNANITVKRTGHGTVTDANGNFYLRNVNSDDVVMVTFIGYKSLSMPIKDHISLTVVMSATTNDLDKVVVQAYGTTSQRLATGNIGVVRAEDIAKQPVMNVLEALQGQVAGVVVTNASGYASGTVKVEIRGRNTISDFPSDPLYIIDGVPLTILDVYNQSNYSQGTQGMINSDIPSPANGQSPFFSINPLDIESLEILKDADATAIYGSRGANGVILITTKKGKAGKTHLDLNIYNGISQVPRHYKMLNTQQYLQMRREAFNNDGISASLNNAPDLYAWDTTRYTDWQKYLWGGTGKTTDVQATLSGGDIKTTFRLGASYRNQTEILSVSGSNQRASISLNLTNKSANQRFSISSSSVYTYTSVNTIYMPSAVTLPPNAPSIFNKLGNLNYSGWAPVQNNFPFGPLLQPYTSQTNFLNSNLTLNYEVFKGLSYRTNLGYNYAQTNQTSFTPIASQNPQRNPTGQSIFGYTTFHNIIIEPQLEYSSFLSKGKLTVLIGASEQKNLTDGVNTFGLGYANDALMSTISNAPIKFVNDAMAEYKYSAIFGRINYNWKDKYIININSRRDGSSRFGPGRQFGTFESIGAAYIFSEEPFIKNNLSFLSFAKIRGSYGTTGNDQIGDYQYLTRWSYSNLSYANIIGLNPQGHTDSLLHWEVNKKTEVALNISILKSLNMEVSWYRNRCNDQLVYFPEPSFTGFTTVLTNTPANVQNTGWEFLLNSNIIEKKQFKWIAKINIGINRNKLLSYPNILQSPYATSLIVGKSLNIRKLLHYTGVDPNTGFYTFADRNHDGIITVDFTGKPDDTYPLDLSQKFDGGVTNTFAYKNWNVTLFFYFKNQIGINALGPLGIPGTNLNNEPIAALQRWQKPGDNAKFAKFTTAPYNNSSYSNFQTFSDGLFTDASFIRLQNLSVAYNIPSKKLIKANISNCKIYLQGQNLFIITKYKGIDPEVQNFGGLPLSRIITVGLSCTF